MKVVARHRHEEHYGAQEREWGSFGETWLPHLDAAHNLARWLLHNDQDAQDVVQEAYLRAFKSFGGFHGSNGRARLLTIVRNTSYQLLKKNRAIDLTAISEDTRSTGEAIEKLPVEFREILVLRHLEGLSYKEMGDIAEVAPGTVMSRLAEARGKLKETLGVRMPDRQTM